MFRGCQIEIQFDIETNFPRSNSLGYYSIRFVELLYGHIPVIVKKTFVKRKENLTSTNYLKSIYEISRTKIGIHASFLFLESFKASILISRESAFPMLQAYVVNNRNFLFGCFYSTIGPNR